MTTNSNQLETKPLPLAGHHTGAPVMALSGWEVPAHFGDPEAEYMAASQSVSLFDASFMTVVSAKGKDVLDYLNRRLSQRVIEQQEGEVQRATQLSGDGRMEADLEFVRPGGEKSYLIAPPAVTGEYLQMVADKYVFTEEAEFVDETNNVVTLALIGPKSDHVFKEVSGSDAPNEGNVVKIDIEGVSCFAYRCAYLANGLALFAHVDEGEKLMQSLENAVTKAGGSKLGFLPFDTIRVESGTPWWGLDLTERTIPLEADLLSAIHTNKGCYPGQETIAKIMNLGHPARKIVGIVWDSEDPLPAGSPLKSGDKEAGTLTSSTFSPNIGKAIGLAMVKWNYREPGTELTIDQATGKTVELPFGAA